MIKASLIGHTIEVFAKFTERPTLPSDIIIRDFFRDRKYLGSTDRRFIGEVYFGTIKHYLRLEAVAQDALKTKFNHPQLVVSAYLLAFKNERPPELQKIIETLGNSFARTYPLDVFEKMADRKREERRLKQLKPAERLALYYSFPIWFAEVLEKDYGPDQVEPILRSLNEEAPTVLRANRIFVGRDELKKELDDLGIQTTTSAIAEDALILSKRLNVWDLKPFKQGHLEVQDEGSQLVAPFAKITSNRIRVLDACAGAGGKSLHFASLLKSHGEIFSTDVDSRKLDEMRKRVVRSNAQNIRIVKPDKQDAMLGPKVFGTFDVVLLDVPCSGTGTIRRNPSIKWRLSDEMHDELIAKQRSILERNAPYVKSRGVLLYSTCSLLRSESEDQVRWFTELHPEFTLEEERRVRPDIEGADGFFVARLRRA
ncbi:MAG: methyltransferase domain-containing protein [Bacteroidetes bacterium]|nr:methyltransferase domain-containing protein [Bacteroidota bacterium]